MGKKIYTRYGVYNSRDSREAVYKVCRTGGYDNSGLCVGEFLPDGRELVASKNKGNGWRSAWTTVYAVRVVLNRI